MEIVSVTKAKELSIDKEVKACPFCGETEDIVVEEYKTIVGNRWRIVCFRCMAGIDRGWDQTPHGLIDAWNRRK